MTVRYAVAAWLLASPPSGANTRLRAILQALPDLLAADERLLVLHAGTPPLPPHPRRDDIALRVPARPTWRRVLAERAGLPAALEELRADLLHLESLPVPRRLPCPVVLTVHDLRDLGPFSRRPRPLFRYVLRQSAARAAALVAPSAFTATELAAVLGGTEVMVVPGTVDADWLRGATGPSAFPGAFLHVGHLEPRKDLGMLLAAYAHANAQASDLPPLVLVGRDGGSLAHLQADVRRLAIGERVHFLGPVDDATLRGLYRQARAVLVPSRCEGFGLPALEALAAGRPVAVSDAGALPEVVGDVGRVVAAGDVAAWSRCLLALAHGTEDDAAATRRRARAERYSAAPAAAALLALWRRVVHARPSGTSNG